MSHVDSHNVDPEIQRNEPKVGLINRDGTGSYATGVVARQSRIANPGVLYVFLSYR